MSFKTVLRENLVMKSWPAAGFLVIGLLSATPGPSPGCGFAETAGNAFTFRRGTAESQLVLYGTWARPRKTSGGDTTDFVIAKIIKDNPVLGAKKVLQISRYIPVDDPNKPARFLLFCNLSKGKIDPISGVEVTPAAVDYLKGLLAIKAKERTQALRYCFNYLEHADSAIALDAYREFVTSPDLAISRVARNLTAAKLRSWLTDPKTPLYRLRLYGFLLGNCGNKKDAGLIRNLLDKLVKKSSSPLIDGILSGYTLLNPKEGWAYVRKLMNDPSNHFQVRYAALRTARFFRNTRPDVIAKKKILDVASICLGQEDIADYAIQYLGEWRWWDRTERILALYNKPSYDKRYLRRAILRYALQCPLPKAAAFVADQRKKDAEEVTEVAESLKLEEESLK
jgi:hypothetical protein